VHRRNPAAGPRLRFSFRVSLVAVSLFTVAVTAAAIHLPWLYVSRQNVGDMAAQLNAEIVRGINKEVDGLFRSATAAQETLRHAIEANVVELADRRGRDRLSFALLRANPHFSWVSFGLPNGDFYGAQRRRDGAFRLVESVWDAERHSALRTEDHYAADGEEAVYARTTRQESDYYAPSRQWYERAMAHPGEPVWTDVYLFAASRRAGINSAITFGPTEAPAGVISVAIELDQISRYLRDLAVGKTGSAFIVSRAGKLIGFKDPSELTAAPAGDGEPAALRDLGASYHPALRLAAEAVRRHEVALDTLSAMRQLVVADPTTGERQLVTLAPSSYPDWIVGTVIPERDFTQRIDANMKRLLAAVLLAVLLVGALVIAVARRLFIAPLERMIAEARFIERLELEKMRHVPSRVIELDSLSAALQQIGAGLASFRKYLPHELVQTLLAQGLTAELGGERRTLTILFMDLAGFTTATERHGHRLLPALADYLGGTSAVIAEEKGTIDKYIGDAVMAFWGAPLANEAHATDAIRAALRCQAVMAELREKWGREKRPLFEARIGINTGRVVVGNIGSPARLDYTVLGDPVNLASRLEGLSKTYGTAIIIGQTTFEHAKYDIVARRLDCVTVKGREEPVWIYEPLAMAEEAGAEEAERFAWVADYERGLDRYFERDWAGALELFRRVVGARGADAPAALFIERCRSQLAKEPARVAAE
jgi:adenylate cyclase